MEATKVFLLGAVSFLLASTAQCENVLFLGLPMFSHFNSMTFLAKELHKRGHNSYIPVTLKLRNSLKISEGTQFLHMKDPGIEEFARLSTQMFSPKKMASWKALQTSMWKMCDSLLLDEEWIESLKAVNASLVVIDGVFMSSCLTIIPYRFSIPFIFMGVQNAPSVHRTPWVYTAFPFVLTSYSEQMSFKERMINSLFLISAYFQAPMGTPSKSIKTYAPAKPDISFDELLRKAELHIVESDVLIDYALPALPNVEYLGGMQTRPAKPIEGDLRNFVDNSKNGIIVVSFGSLISELPKEHLHKIGAALKKIKYDVVWKWSDISYSSPNVFITKWMPQNDLLGHPKTRLFITHCGNGGQFESFYHAVPMLGFPVYADQSYNGKRIEEKGFGISMDLHNYTVEDLVANMNKIISNPKYKNNIKMASDIFKSRPEHPSVRGARIVDDVIKYGGGFMRSYCQDMPLYQYFMLDILAVVLASVIIVILITVFILRKCFSFLCRKKEKIE